MDIISHTLTGVAVGTVAATFSKKSWKTKVSIVLTGGLGGALPDLDAVSLWSGFDGTIGALFDLSHSGRDIYFGKFWYSHHAALHSLLAPLLFCFMFVGIVTIRHKYWTRNSIKGHLQRNGLYYLAFILGFVCHLLEDMPTPASVWGGVNLFFPSSGYVGGFGKIWWWNNYDIFLIILSVIFMNSWVNLIPNTRQKLRSRTAVAIFVLGLGLGMNQMLNRPIDFRYTGHTTKYTQYEQQSKDIQKDILGKRLYGLMEKLDDRLPVYF